MEYTDKYMKEATQVSYLYALEKGMDNLLADGRKGPFTLREIIVSAIGIDEETKRSILDNKDNIDELQRAVKASDLSDWDKEIIELFDNVILDWKIVDINDRNDLNGFYACVIEVEPNQTIVSFRGSEDMHKYTNFVNDWVKADFGLLNSKATEQELEAERYADQLINDGKLTKYKSLGVTGHSLGGSLASHFTIACADSSRAEIFNKIDSSINFDGPGCSTEYMEAQKDRIARAAPKLKHYKWSAVGNLLYDIPGENTEILKIDQKQHKKSILDRLKYKLITRHHTRSIMFNEDGMAERGKHVDLTSGILGGLS